MKFSELVAGKTIVIPVYQRAFAWGDDLIKWFIADLQKCQTQGLDYYYGHFILEQNDEQYEVIDGQQRLTLAALFITYCHKVHSIEPDNHLLEFSQLFRTVSYDIFLYSKIRQDLRTKSPEQIAEDLKTKPRSLIVTPQQLATQTAEFLQDQPEIELAAIRELCTKTVEEVNKSHEVTLSALRLVQALKVIDDESKKLGQGQLPDLLAVLGQATVSEHLIDSKNVAVQMFELHNTRGIPLTFMDKVKAKLMQFVYQHGGDSREDYVQQIQRKFGRIYRMEEDLKATSFRGNLSLQELFYYHLRMIDDGHSTDYTQPSQNSEQNIIDTYLVNRLQEDPEPTTYALSLAFNFAESVRIFCEDLPKLDPKEGYLVGDVLLLDKARSTELFLLICHNGAEINTDQLRLWEKLLFIQDFHNLYHRKQYKEDFPGLYGAIMGILDSPYTKSDQEQAITDVLTDYVQGGFHDYMAGLPYIVCANLIKNRDNMLQDAYNFWQEKMRYLLYKYEKSNRVDLPQLRKLIKEKETLEYILPREWQWEWIEEYCPSDEQQNLFHEEKMGQHLHGIGNLLLLSHEENLQLGSDHPAEKEYSISGGSYQWHKENKGKWNESKEWINLIQERGQRIVDFLFTYFFAKEHETLQQSRRYAEQLKQEFDSQDSEIVWGLHKWLAYQFDIGLIKPDENKGHIRLFVLVKDDDFAIELCAWFWFDTIIGKTQAAEKEDKQNKVRTIVKDNIGLNSDNDDSGEWSITYPVAEMDSFVTKLKEVIKKLEAAGFQPLPKG